MKTNIRLSKENRAKLILMLAEGELQNADAIAAFLGVKDGIDTAFFEYCISKEGLTDSLIQAIAEWFKPDIERHNKELAESKA